MDKSATYTEVLTMLRRELGDLRERAKQVEAAIAVIERLVPQSELFPSRRVVADLTKIKIARNGLGGMKMIDAAETVLRDAGRPMHIMEIIREMLARGFSYDKDEKALRASLTGSIERKETFKREGRATYGLSIWAKSGETDKEAGAAE